MKLIVRKKRHVIEYPSLGCRGRWNLVSISGSRVVFRERITKGAEKVCSAWECSDRAVELTAD